MTSIASRVGMVWSSVSVSCSPWVASTAFSRSMKVRTSSSSLKVLTRAFLVNASEIAGCPSIDASCDGLARAHVTWATSPKRANAPGRMVDVTVSCARRSGSSSTPLTAIVHTPCRVASVPAAVSRQWARSASATSAAVSPRTASAAGSGRTSSSGSRSPEANTWSTPRSRSRAWRMRRPSRRSTSSSAGPVSRMMAVGKPLEVEISSTRGSRASSGSSALALFWISRRRSFMRLSKVRSSMSPKRTSRLETFSRELELTNRMSATPWMASSSGLVTSRSTSSALAPGSTVVTLTQLKLISGSRSRGICT